MIADKIKNMIVIFKPGVILLVAIADKIKNMIVLFKPGVILLVAFSGFVGMFTSPVAMSSSGMMISMLGIIFGGASAASFNMWYDSDIDKIMHRTKTRPIPRGYIGKRTTLFISCILSASSVGLLFFLVNTISAALLFVGIISYAIIYTIYLKRSTAHNIVIGGIAGSIAPLIGRAAATGSIDLESILLFTIIFLWTPPHFWALALLRKDEYKKVGIPMMPVIYGSWYTKVSIFVYTIALIISTSVFSILCNTGIIYDISSLALGITFIVMSCMLYFDKYPAFKVFRFSIFYMFLLLASVILDHILPVSLS